MTTAPLASIAEGAGAFGAVGGLARAPSELRRPGAVGNGPGSPCGESSGSSPPRGCRPWTSFAGSRSRAGTDSTTV